MRSLILISIFTSLCLFSAIAEPLNKKGALLDIDFSNPKELTGWRLPKGIWTIENETLKGVELESDHHSAGAAHALDYHDAVIHFRFKFSGAKNGQFLIRNRFGNLCRIVFLPDHVRVQRDKPNIPKDTKEKTVFLAKQSIRLDDNAWHQAIVTVKGDTLSVQIDDSPVLSGKHPAIDADKTEVEFFATGDAVFYDDLRVDPIQ